MNWYNYVGSDPVNFSDPSGLIEICLPITVAGRPSEWSEKGGGTTYGPRTMQHCQDIPTPGLDGDQLGIMNLDWSLSDITVNADPCAVALTEPGHIKTLQLSGSAIALLGLTGALGKFWNSDTGTTGYFFSAGGGVGGDIGASFSGSDYNNLVSFNGFNENVNVGLSIPFGVAWSRHDDLSGNRVGNSFGPSIGAKASLSATLTETNLFLCKLGGKK